MQQNVCMAKHTDKKGLAMCSLIKQYITPAVAGQLTPHWRPHFVKRLRCHCPAAASAEPAVPVGQWVVPAFLPAAQLLLPLVPQGHGLPLPALQAGCCAAHGASCSSACTAAAAATTHPVQSHLVGPAGREPEQQERTT